MGAIVSASIVCAAAIVFFVFYCCCCGRSEDEILTEPVSQHSIVDTDGLRDYSDSDLGDHDEEMNMLVRHHHQSDDTLRKIPKRKQHQGSIRLREIGVEI